MKMNGMKGMNGMIRMISLALSGRISHVLLKSCDRIPSKFMPILDAVCKDRNVQIISTMDYGKDLVATAEIELHRRKKNIEISNEMNVAIKSINELWDDPQRRKVNDSLEDSLLLPRAGLKEAVAHWPKADKSEAHNTIFDFY